MNSNSGVSLDMSEDKRNSYAYETSDTVELRIIEENEDDFNQNSTLLNFNNHTKFQIGRQESHQSISVILDNI